MKGIVVVLVVALVLQLLSLSLSSSSPDAYYVEALQTTTSAARRGRSGKFDIQIPVQQPDETKKTIKHQQQNQIQHRNDVTLIHQTKNIFDNSNNNNEEIQLMIVPEKEQSFYQNPTTSILAVLAVVFASILSVDTNNNRSGISTSLFSLLNRVPAVVTESCVALTCSIIVVSMVTAMVETMTTTTVPTFDVNAERFDQSTFTGRFFKMLLGCDPRLLLYNEEEVRQCLAITKNYQDYYNNHIPQPQQGNNNNTKKEIDRMLWEAKRIADSALHPDTEEWIPRPFRMSGYLPFNGPICVAMVVAPTTTALLFWSWLNQSQNALVNYYNRSSSSSSSSSNSSSSSSASTKIQTQTTTTTNNNKNDIDTILPLVKSYAVAVGTALMIAFGLDHMVHSNFDGEQATSIARFISFPSAIIASSLNCFIVRSPEIDTGIPLLDEHGQNTILPGETSQIAARYGVYATTASRAILQVPTFCIPPLLLDSSLLPLKDYVQCNPSTEVPITTFLLLVSFGIGLPIVIGLLPQLSKIHVKDVEAKYANLGYEEFYFDKGL